MRYSTSSFSAIPLYEMLSWTSHSWDSSGKELHIVDVFIFIIKKKSYMADIYAFMYSFDFFLNVCISSSLGWVLAFDEIICLYLYIFSCISCVFKIINSSKIFDVGSHPSVCVSNQLISLSHTLTLSPTLSLSILFQSNPNMQRKDHKIPIKILFWAFSNNGRLWSKKYSRYCPEVWKSLANHLELNQPSQSPSFKLILQSWVHWTRFQSIRGVYVKSAPHSTVGEKHLLRTLVDNLQQ